jgi:hypothetical protein
MRSQNQAGALDGPSQPMTIAPRYVVTTYRALQTHAVHVTREEACNLAAEREVDLQIDPVFGHTFVRKADGDIVELGYGLPRVGSTRREILYLLMREPGIAKTVGDIFRELDLDSLADASNVAAAARCLRRGLLERASSARFLFSARDPYRLWWNRDRPYRVIEPAEVLPHDAGSARFHEGARGPA